MSPVIATLACPRCWLVYTDELPNYRSLRRLYEHKRIHHAERIYVAGDVHTNTIEGFFSLVKRGLSGVYHSVSTRTFCPT